MEHVDNFPFLELKNGSLGGNRFIMEKTNHEKMLDEEEYFPDQELADLAYECSEGLQLINSQPPRSEERQMFLQKFFGSIGSHVTIKGNFNCDYGKNIYIGSGTIIN